MAEPNENPPPESVGMWGWILLIVSAAFAMPNSISEPPIKESKLPRSSNCLFSPMKWMNPLRWIPSLSILPSDHGPPNSPTTYLETVELAQYYGYSAERHFVTTEDGYILGLHRLPSGRKNKNKEDEVTSRPVVLIHHAFLTTSREFLILGPQRSLAFILSDSGYDVWLCNSRGNTYSRNHTSLKPEQKEFWDFSYHEHGTHDLPAVINYVLKESGRSKLHYVGFSMGTIAFFIMSSERPDMLNKIETYTGMGPVTTTANSRSRTLRLIMSTTKFAVAIMQRLGLYEFFPHYKWLTFAGQTVCNNGRITQPFCTGIIYALSGKSTTMEVTILPEMLAHTPSGTSLKTLTHFAQNYHSGFRKFDYGSKENEARYGSKTPPFYNIKHGGVPTQLFYGMNDLLGDYTEALNLCKTLPNVFKCEKVPDDTFTHLDFIWSDKAYILLYPSILDGIKRFENSKLNETKPRLYY